MSDKNKGKQSNEFFLEETWNTKDSLIHFHCQVQPTLILQRSNKLFISMTYALSCLLLSLSSFSLKYRFF